MDAVTAILGTLGRVIEGVSEAISAARAKNEEEAFSILEKALTETASSVIGLRAKIKANREAAEKALADRFLASDGPQPTVLVDPDDDPEKTQP